MNLERTQEVIYEQASSRFRDHFDSSKLLCKQLLDSDDKLVSRVCNNTRREKKNKYLFTPTLIEETIKNTQMNFPNEMALLWGNEDEIKEYIYSLFFAIILDFLSARCKNEAYNKLNQQEFDIEDCLIDYVPFAKYATYYHLFVKHIDDDNVRYWGIDVPTVLSEYVGNSRDEAIHFLYNRCKEGFFDIFCLFAKETKSFHKLDKRLNDCFIDKRLIPLLKQYLPKEDSLGLRVKNLIIGDLSSVPNLIKNGIDEDDPKHQYLIAKNRATSDYILELEDIFCKYNEII